MNKGGTIKCLQQHTTTLVLILVILAWVVKEVFEFKHTYNVLQLRVGKLEEERIKK